MNFLMKKKAKPQEPVPKLPPSVQPVQPVKPVVYSMPTTIQPPPERVRGADPPPDNVMVVSSTPPPVAFVSQVPQPRLLGAPLINENASVTYTPTTTNPSYDTSFFALAGQAGSASNWWQYPAGGNVNLDNFTLFNTKNIRLLDNDGITTNSPDLYVSSSYLLYEVTPTFPRVVLTSPLTNNVQASGCNIINVGGLSTNTIQIQSGIVNLRDTINGSNATLEASASNLYFNGEIIATNSNTSNVADWSLFPVSNPLGVNFNDYDASNMNALYVSTATVSSITSVNVSSLFIVADVGIHNSTITQKLFVSSIQASTIQSPYISSISSVTKSQSIVSQDNGTSLGYLTVDQAGSNLYFNGALIGTNSNTSNVSQWSLYTTLSNTPILGFPADPNGLTVGSNNLLTKINGASILETADDQFTMTAGFGMKMSNDRGIDVLAPALIDISTENGQYGYVQITADSGDDIQGTLNEGGLIKLTANSAISGTTPLALSRIALESATTTISAGALGALSFVPGSVNLLSGAGTGIQLLTTSGVINIASGVAATLSAGAGVFINGGVQGTSIADGTELFVNKIEPNGSNTVSMRQITASTITGTVDGPGTVINMDGDLNMLFGYGIKSAFPINISTTSAIFPGNVTAQQSMTAFGTMTALGYNFSNGIGFSAPSSNALVITNGLGQNISLTTSTINAQYIANVETLNVNNVSSGAIVVSSINGAPYAPGGAGVTSLNTLTGPVQIVATNLGVNTAGTQIVLNIPTTVTTNEIVPVSPITKVSIPTLDIVSPNTSITFGLSVSTITANVNNGSAYTVFVAADGSDITGIGTQILPYATLAQALTSISAIATTIPVVIIIGPGTFAGATLTRSNTFIIGAGQTLTQSTTINTAMVFNITTSAAATITAGLCGVILTNSFSSSTTGVTLPSFYFMRNVNVVAASGVIGMVLSQTSSTGVCSYDIQTTNITALLQRGISAFSTNVTLTNCTLTTANSPNLIFIGGNGTLIMSGCRLTSTNTASTALALVSINNANTNTIPYNFINCQLVFTSSTADTGTVLKTCVQFNSAVAVSATISNCLFQCVGSTRGSPLNQCISNTGAGAVALTYGDIQAVSPAVWIDPTITRTVLFSAQQGVNAVGGGAGDYLVWDGNQWVAGSTNVSIGRGAGNPADVTCVNIGQNAGTGVNTNGVAIGNGAGTTTTTNNTIAIGQNAGQTASQGAISIGAGAGIGAQINSICIGNNGVQALGPNSIMIGTNTGIGGTTFAQGSIILNATGNTINPNAGGSFKVLPVRSASATPTTFTAFTRAQLCYNIDLNNGEVTYDTSSFKCSVITAPTTLTLNPTVFGSQYIVTGSGTLTIVFTALLAGDAGFFVTLKSGTAASVDITLAGTGLAGYLILHGRGAFTNGQVATLFWNGTTLTAY